MTPTAEIYSPTSGQFSTVGSLGTGRFSHAASLLPNGNVLITGGVDSHSNVLASAEIYSFSAHAFTPTGGMHTARFEHTSTQLADGTVLVSGGQTSYYNSTFTSSAEIYSLNGGGFAGTGGMSVPRAYQTATLLHNGQVFIAGGTNTPSGALQPLQSAETYTYPYTSGTLAPKYVVLGVLYSPPGAKSSVSYSQSVAQGTSSSIKSIFQDQTSVSTTLGIGDLFKNAGIPLPSATGTASLDWTMQNSSSSTYSMMKTTNEQLGADGPLSSAIGVDHDYDKIVVWLPAGESIRRLRSIPDIVEWILI